jgi:hypothetical protein
VKLTDLNPKWIGSGGPGVTCEGKPVPRREGVMLTFDCPCGCQHPIAVYIDPPLDGNPSDPHCLPKWARTGEAFEALTLTPSILRRGGCGWHGFVTNGELVTC